MKLKVTHLQRHGEGSWYLRFSGVEHQVTRLRNDLRSQPTYVARLEKYVTWPDGKKGAWWIEDRLLLMYADRFGNLQEMADKALAADKERKEQEEQEYREFLRDTYIPPDVVEGLKVLGLATDTKPDKDILKKAFRKLARQYHPDMGGTHAQFKRLNNANETILNWIENSGMVADWSA